MKNILYLLLMLVSTSVFAQTGDCDSFKDGKFVIVNSETGNSIIERKGDKQIEYGEGSKLKLAFDVKWVDECTYILELTDVLENPRNYNIPDSAVFTIEIIATKENSYTQRTSSNLFSETLTSELHKIE